MLEKDKAILRELAMEVAEIAALPVQKQKTNMWRHLNRLDPVKPMVWINEIPWHEMGHEVKLKTSNEFCRNQERYLRRILYQWRLMRCDMVVEPKVFCPLTVHDTGFGIKADIVNVEGDIGYGNPRVITGSSDFEPVIKNEEDIEKIHILESIPNLRKISISPWADREKAVANFGEKYVISLKPNPAILAVENWNPDAARAELYEDLEKTKGCAVEVIMKDISTCRNQPHRLWEWANIAMEVTEEFG